MPKNKATDHDPGWAQRAIKSPAMSTCSTHLGRLAKMHGLGHELIDAAEWAAVAIERKSKGDLAGALAAAETAALHADRVRDMLPECIQSNTAFRRRLEKKLGLEPKPSNLWYAEIGRMTRATQRIRVAPGMKHEYNEGW